MAIKFIEELPIGGKRTFVRVDFNVPLSGGKVSDDTRIREALPTIKHAISRGARLILASHLGRPKGKRNPDFSLMPVGERLRELLEMEIIVAEDCVGDGVRKLAADLREGQVLLLENLRFYKEEEANDPGFSEKLAQLADVYVNDAFGCAHRAHASTAGMVAHVKHKGIGYLMRKELKYLGELLGKPNRPFVAVLGGAKVSDKIAVISSLLVKADAVLIGGAMAYTFLKAQGVAVGKSLVEEDKLKVASDILKQARERKVEILLPVDHVVAASPDDAKGEVVKGAIPEGRMGLDIGPSSVAAFGTRIASARTVFWNGPLGMFERPAFAEGTLSMARALADSKAVTVVGGGDSVAAIQQSGVAERITHISTGGGASLELVEGKTLPGVAALEE